MSKFHFKLQTLLEHREQVERGKQADLARAAARVTALKTQLAELTAVKREGASDVVRNHRFLTAVASRIANVRREMTTAERDHTAARSAFTAAAKERKSIELLREKALDAWRRKHAAEEDRALDDLAAWR
jgi:flagellar export protein FliJ